MNFFFNILKIEDNFNTLTTFGTILKNFRCLKLHFKKTCTFLELHQSAAAVAAAMIFTIEKKYFRKPHIHSGLFKKKFEKIMKNIGDMAKRTFIKKMQKTSILLYVKS